MLQKVRDYNDLSTELRKQLAEERKKVGRYVKYKFYVAKKNPDGLHKPGEEYLYPGLYTLTPVTYKVLDPGDKQYKQVGLTDGVDRQNKDIEEVIFRRITVRERDMGIVTLDLEQPEHVQDFEYLEMHPKNENGFFRDMNAPAMFCRIDELKEAKTRSKNLEMRGMVISVAARMTEEEVRSFAAAMNWNELEDFDIIKDRMLTLADKDPEFFRKFVDDPRNPYRATLRRAIDANVIGWIPLENKFIWQSNGATIAMLDKSEGGEYFDKMSDWLMVSKNGPETYKKIISMLTGK